MILLLEMLRVCYGGWRFCFGGFSGLRIFGSTDFVFIFRHYLFFFWFYRVFYVSALIFGYLNLEFDWFFILSVFLSFASDFWPSGFLVGLIFVFFGFFTFFRY